MPVCYEDFELHGGRGTRIAFSDGFVAFIESPRAERVIEGLLPYDATDEMVAVP